LPRKACLDSGSNCGLPHGSRRLDHPT
jgi:hypothetical protein